VQYGINADRLHAAHPEFICASDAQCTVRTAVRLNRFVKRYIWLAIEQRIQYKIAAMTYKLRLHQQQQPPQHLR